ncbi:MAG: hypothetical protein AAGH79_06015 [Bacteroidota bacterium]
MGVIPIIFLLVAANVKWSGSQWQALIATDAKGYYDYFPALFIYQDLQFNFYDDFKASNYYAEHKFQDYRRVVPGGTINKYFAGVALAQLPFTMAAHVLAEPLGFPPDGFSKPYQIAVSLAGIFYACLGLWFIWLLLGQFGIAPIRRNWVIALLAFGTHLFVYAVPEPGMSHAYSLAFMSIFFYAVLRFQKEGLPSALMVAGLAFGMILLIRPVNGLALLAIPFLLGSWQNVILLWQRMWERPLWLLFCLFLGLSVAGLQLLIYYLQTGSWVHYSYPGEGFDFSEPAFWSILFSYRKGLFLYTPILLVSLAGFYYFQCFRRWAGLVFLVLLTYVFSSWSNWWYGGSFSSRPYVEYLPIFGIGLGVLLENSRGNLRTEMLSLLVVLGLLCQIQIYQYRYYQIHYSEMTKDWYWDVFLRIDQLINK